LPEQTVRRRLGADYAGLMEEAKERFKAGMLEKVIKGTDKSPELAWKVLKKIDKRFSDKTNEEDEQKKERLKIAHEVLAPKSLPENVNVEVLPYLGEETPNGETP
jgi:predicted transcriptional regulator